MAGKPRDSAGALLQPGNNLTLPRVREAGRGGAELRLRGVAGRAPFRDAR